MATIQEMLDEAAAWEDEEDEEDEDDEDEDDEDEDDEPVYRIDRTLKNAFGESFENLTAKKKLALLAAVCWATDNSWTQALDWFGLGEDPDFVDLIFRDSFESTYEVFYLIRDLSAAIARDESFHELAIGK